MGKSGPAPEEGIFKEGRGAGFKPHPFKNILSTSPKETLFKPPGKLEWDF